MLQKLNYVRAAKDTTNAIIPLIPASFLIYLVLSIFFRDGTLHLLDLAAYHMTDGEYGISGLKVFFSNQELPLLIFIIAYIPFAIFIASFILSYPVFLILQYFDLNANLESKNKNRYFTKRPVNPAVQYFYYYIVVVFFLEIVVFYCIYFLAIDTVMVPVSFLIIAIGLIAFFLPSIIAYHRQHHNIAAITLTNLTLGITVIGWFVALIWSSTSLNTINKETTEEDFFEKYNIKRLLVNYAFSTVLGVLTYLITHYLFGFGVTESSLSSFSVAMILGAIGYNA